MHIVPTYLVVARERADADYRIRSTPSLRSSLLHKRELLRESRIRRTNYFQPPSNAEEYLIVEIKAIKAELERRGSNA